MIKNDELNLHVFNINNLQYLNCGPLSLQLQSTECVGLSGESGSGKSRLLRALADLDEHQGEIQLDTLKQQDISAHLWRKKIALLSAESYWWFDTVSEHFNSLSADQLVSLGFSEDVADWSVSRLSSGEKQRLGLLRLLENQPEVLLLDEPTANLDQQNVTLFEKTVFDYLQQQAACAIWVSHDMDQLHRVSQRQFVLKNGLLESL